MKHRNQLLMSGLFALTMGFGISATAFAYQDEFSRKSPNYNASFVSEMNKVLTARDYGAWKELVEDKLGAVDEVITAEKFPQFTEAWKLANQGKIKEANAIRKALEKEAKI